MRFLHQHALWTAIMLIVAAGSANAGTIEGRVQSHRASLDLSAFVVYVDDVEGPFPPPDHAVVMDQKALRFVPHVLAVETGTTVIFANSDPLAHNVFSISSPKRFNLGLYERGVSRSMKFDQPGVVQLLCNVHQEMSGYIVVVKNPYFATTGRDGSFRIESVPAGKHVLRVWHEGMDEATFAVQVAPTGVSRTTLRVD